MFGQHILRSVSHTSNRKHRSSNREVWPPPRRAPHPHPHPHASAGTFLCTPTEHRFPIALPLPLIHSLKSEANNIIWRKIRLQHEPHPSVSVLFESWKTHLSPRSSASGPVSTIMRVA